MRRPQPVLWLLLASVLTASVLAGSATRDVAAQVPRERPNFVVIVTDDLSKKMYRRAAGLRNGSESAGVEFVNAFAPTPLCCPARVTILTGRYAHHHGVRHNEYKTPDLAVDLFGSERMFLERGLEQRTVALLLGRSGYMTSLMGRYMNGYGGSDGGPGGRDPDRPPDEPHENGSARSHVPPGWSDWHAWLARGINDNGDFRCLARCAKLRPTADGSHRTDVLARSAKRFVDASRSSRRPFFLYLADYVPHRENPPVDRHAHAHDGAAPPRDGSHNEEDVSDKPGYIARDKKLTPAGTRPPACSETQYPFTYPTSDQGCVHSEDYSQHVWENGLEGLESIDDLYDGLVARLRATGQLDNTYIFLVSDNGIHLGEHRQGYGKNTPYIEDLGIPFTVRGPGVPRERKRTHLVGLQDIAPTLADLAGLAPPDGMDGRSLAPLLSSRPPPTTGWRGRMLIEGYRGARVDVPGPARDDSPEWRGLVSRDGRKYAEYATGERELYRLDGDPHELVNQASSAADDELQRLRDEVTRLRGCRGRAQCRAAEDR